MHATRRLSLGIVLCALVGAACTQGGGATTAPAATTTATIAPATSAPVVTAAPATTAPTAAASVPAGSAAFAVFAPKAGATPQVQGGAVLAGVGGQTQVVIAVQSTGTETMAAAIQAGTCGSLTPEMAYRLTDVVSGASTTTVDVELATLLASPYAINIIVAGSETESSITCGEIKAGVAP